MKALTVRQPHAAFIARGAKPIETRGWSTSYRGPLIIHAGTKCAAGDFGPYNVEDDTPRRSAKQYLMRGPIAWPYRLPLGAVVASCVLADVVPIIDRCGTDMNAPAHICQSAGSLLFHRPRLTPFLDGETEHIITDQLPFGDFTPGRYAWLLEDVKPTTARCPWCWSTPAEWAEDSLDGNPCIVCAEAGSVDPIPAKGRQGLWTWTVMCGLTNPGDGSV